MIVLLDAQDVNIVEKSKGNFMVSHDFVQRNSDGPLKCNVANETVNV